ncbi:MAG: hypothetical protein HY075_14770 [Deltaproteobacteria bacterium]|nr:hypothetical protein [Deltaproteobacteria bacterium]
MRTKSTALLGVLGFTTFLAAPAWAALPPYWQSAREIEAILKNEAVQQALQSVSPIRELARTEQGYKLTLQDGCYALVRVGYLKNPMPGPAKFELKVLEAGCKR